MKTIVLMDLCLHCLDEQDFPSSTTASDGLFAVSFHGMGKKARKAQNSNGHQACTVLEI